MMPQSENSVLEKLSCKGITYLDMIFTKPCPRRAQKGLPYCWQHGEQAREAVAALEADGSDGSDFKLRYLSYRRRAFDQLIFKTIVSRKARHVLRPLDGDRHGLSLGYLERLPMELLFGIFSYLTIPELQSFKATNSRGHLMAWSDTRHSSIVTHAPGLIAALYATGLQSAFTLGRIHTAFARSTCTICNSFGGYIFLPGLQRCCQRCASCETELQPVPYETALHEYQISEKAARAIPTMFISSKHHGGRLPVGSRGPDGRLVSRAEARRFGTRDSSTTPPPKSNIWYNFAIVCL